MNNHTYDLVKALGEKAEAANVYSKYMQDANACKDCLELWKKLETQEQQEIEEMKKILISHAKQNTL